MRRWQTRLRDKDFCRRKLKLLLYFFELRKGLERIEDGLTVK